MRVPFVAANWKMHHTPSSARSFMQELGQKLSGSEADVVVFPPFPVIPAAAESRPEKVRLGAQNLHWEEKGAFTGEVSADMLLELGVEFVIIGHSERRQLFGETDEMINLKLKRALSAGLTPVLCIGETLKERQQGRTFDKLRFQLDADLSGVDVSRVIIAYEPIWAIGTGVNATPEQAQEAHSFIKEHLGQVRVIYGGSVKPSNCRELALMEDVDGFLVGGASLQTRSFYDIIQISEKAFKEKS